MTAEIGQFALILASAGVDRTVWSSHDRRGPRQ